MYVWNRIYMKKGCRLPYLARGYAKSVLGRGSRCFAHPANTLVRKRLTTVFTGWLCAPARFTVTDGSRCDCACHMPPRRLNFAAVVTSEIPLITLSYSGWTLVSIPTRNTLIHL